MTNALFDEVLEMRQKGKGLTQIFREISRQNRTDFYTSFNGFYVAFGEEVMKRRRLNLQKEHSNFLVLSAQKQTEQKENNMQNSAVPTVRFNIRPETMFRASDNSVHSTRTDAELRESALALRQLFIAKGIHDNGELRRFCFELSENFDRYAPVFTKIKSTKARAKKQKSA